MFLRPAMKQAGSRLNVLTNSLVTRVIFDKRQATGIEYVNNGQTKRAFASREVGFITRDSRMLRASLPSSGRLSVRLSVCLSVRLSHS